MMELVIVMAMYAKGIKNLRHVIYTSHPWIGGFSVLSALATWTAPFISLLLESQGGYVFSYG
jgi:hypothetical protein